MSNKKVTLTLAKALLNLQNILYINLPKTIIIA